MASTTGSTGAGDTGSDGSYAPAASYTPAGTIDWAQMINALVAAAPGSGAPALDKAAASDAGTQTGLRLIAWLWSLVPADIREGGQITVDAIILIGQFLIAIIEKLLEPGKDILGALAGAYVSDFANEQRAMGRTGGATTTPSGVASVAAGAYDSICAPLGLTTGVDPSKNGAGQQNSQFVLGSLINLHLNTWLINIISNLTGFGFLKFINSFDDCILAAMNTRAMGRLAFKPYMQTLMVDPLTRDLQQQFPIKDAGTTAIIREFIRGATTSADMNTRLAQHGLGATYSAELLSELQKEMSLSDLAWLVARKYWTYDQAQTYLAQIGYPSLYTALVIDHAVDAFEEPWEHELLAEWIYQYENKLIDYPTFVSGVGTSATTTQNGTRALAVGQLKHDRPKRLTYGQVKALFLENLWNADQVETWLTEEGYSAADVQSLFLLDFAQQSERQLVAARLGAKDRLESVINSNDAATATAKANAAKAAAYESVSAAYDAIAKEYGY